jgi:uncharacterized delta-60 repeat protein
MALLLAVAAVALPGPLAAPAHAAVRPGSLDYAFGSCGVSQVAMLDDWGHGNTGTGVAVQPDGRMLVSGSPGVLTRLMPDGTVDLSFGTLGTAKTPDGKRFAGEGVAVQPDGRIVVLGAKEIEYNRWRVGFVRFLADGRPDPTFGSGGEVLVEDGLSLVALAVQPDGAILAAGAQGGPVVVRLSASGGPDLTFGVAGRSSFPASGGIRALALQPDGRIVVGMTVGDDETQDWALARLLPGGALDASFGGTGIVTQDMGGRYEWLTDVAVDSAGAVVATGTSRSIDNNDAIGLARRLPSGEPDVAFGDQGRVVAANPSPSATSRGVAVGLQDDGKVVVASRVADLEGWEAGRARFALSRYSSAGALDTSFGERAGFTFTAFPFGYLESSAADPADLARTPTGDWVVAGGAGSTWENFRTVIRYRGDAGAATDPGVVTAANCTRRADLKPVRIDYGRPLPGGRIDARQVTITSTGTGPLRINRITSRPGRGSLTLVSDGCTGATLAPGASCKVWVAYGGDTDLIVWDNAGWGWQLIGLGAGAPTGWRGWGWNGVGQRGDGTTSDSAVPVFAPSLDWFNTNTVASGAFHNLILSYGTVIASGLNHVGELGDGTTVERHGVVPVKGLTQVANIAAGAFHNLALKGDGTVWTWGWNALGQLGDGTTLDRHVPVRVPGLTGVVAVAAGAYHSLALKSDGTVWAWGLNHVGQLGDGTTVERHAPVRVTGLMGVTALGGGAFHSLAVRSDGTVRTWGWNYFGQLGDGTTVDRLVPVRALGLNDVTGVANGAYYHSLALTKDGEVRAWGLNNVGQLGDGTTVDRHAPVPIPGLTGMDTVAGGAFHSLAAPLSGGVWVWGWNAYGQLGDGTTADRHTPFLVQPNLSFERVSAGVVHSLSD